MAVTNIRGVKVDADAIAAGLYDVMLTDLDPSYQGAMAFGMLPAPLMESAERNVRIVIGEVVKDKAELDRYVRDIMHQISVAMLGEAKKRGKLVV